ncbi:g13467 [Coccomyxa viridis]|uniref:G13467 protein n=1 Tax=Coccomyxa viridis TaxID=1274662 RepID=A0ABP1GJZ0_9CHLO
MDRRAAIGGLLGAGLLIAAPAALAKDIGAAARAKEERRAALAKAAEDMKSTGKAESAFEDSGYAVGEDHSPNSHTRQEEGARTSK